MEENFIEGDINQGIMEQNPQMFDYNHALYEYEIGQLEINPEITQEHIRMMEDWIQTIENDQILQENNDTTQHNQETTEDNTRIVEYDQLEIERKFTEMIEENLGQTDHNIRRMGHKQQPTEQHLKIIKDNAKLTENIKSNIKMIEISILNIKQQFSEIENNNKIIENYFETQK